MPFFKIKGLSPALNGLTVSAVDCTEAPELGLIEIRKFVNTNMMVGDRTLSFPVEEKALFINFEFLEAVSDPQIRQYAHDNPWGECLFEGNYVRGTLTAAIARFENTVQVSLTEKVDGKTKTLWTGYFHKSQYTTTEILHTAVTGIISRYLADPSADAEELLFALKRASEIYYLDGTIEG